MEEKRFGVKVHLIQELRRFQSHLKYKRKTMAFMANADITVNAGPSARRQIHAHEGRLSIIPSIFPKGLCIPKQNLVEIDSRTVRVQLDIELQVTIRFDTEDEKNHFETSMGNLNLSSSSDESSPKEN